MQPIEHLEHLLLIAIALQHTQHHRRLLRAADVVTESILQHTKQILKFLINLQNPSGELYGMVNDTIAARLMEVLPTLRSALSRKDFDKKFQPAFRELEYLRLMAFKRKGFWIFQAHTFSMGELLESPQFTKIETVVGKIGDDVENWLKNGQLSFFDKQFYWENRIILENQVHQLRTEIIKRQPTWWEGFCNIFNYWIDLFMSKLPEIANSFFPIQIAHLALKTASGQKMIQRLLPSLKQ